MRVFLLSLVLLSWTSAALADPAADLQQEARRQTEAILAAGHDWPVVETEHFTIHHQPGLRPDPVACAALDSFTREVAQIVEFATADLHLDYYLCDDATVQQVTGYPTKGMADLAGRAVISSHFPHFHELVHLLVYAAQDDPPAQTLPLIQEGLATLLGGRSGRAPEVVLFMGWLSQSMQPMDWHRALTQRGFHEVPGGADATYPLGAMVCELMRRELGWPGVLELNERLSGSLEFVSGLSVEDVLGTMGKLNGQGLGRMPVWLSDGLHESWNRNRRCGIVPPGRTGGGQVFTVRADSFPVYLLSPADDHENAVSSTWEEHFIGQQPYRGQRYGLRVSPDDIALYDYATNQLLAIWVAGFTSEFGACSPEEGVVSFGLTADSPYQALVADLVKE